MNQGKYEELLAENQMLRREIKVAREAADITSAFVVSQFEQTEQMLHRYQSANSQRQAVLDAATQLSIIATDLEGKITLFSRGAANLLGYTDGEMVGKKNILSLHLDGELARYADEVTGISKSNLSDMQVFDQYVKQKRTRAREWIYICRDGQRLPVSLSITGLFDAAGRMIGYLFTAMDMTARKKMEAELTRAKEFAESANASKGDFLARMSHEIRTPMNGIIGMGYLIQKTELTQKQQSYVETILGSANTLLGLINDILDFSKIDAGKMELESIPFDLEEVLGNISNIVGINAEEKQLEFLFRIDPDVPCNLVGDPLRLGQVLMNLAGNAVKFTDAGEIVISVNVQERTENSAVLRFSVADTGVGLEPGQISRLFEAFSQADDSTTRKYGGTGLGLAICKQLTKMMGGKIWAKGNPGRGANFFFTSNFGISQEPREYDSKSLKTLGAIRGARILLVDDNSINQQVATGFLHDAGMVVEVASSGLESLEALEQSHFDLVLMDIQMPGMDGLETTRRIRMNHGFRPLPIVAMTAHAMAGDREKSFAAGMDDHITKPVEPAVLYGVLKRLIPEKHRDDSLGEPGLKSDPESKPKPKPESKFKPESKSKSDGLPVLSKAGEPLELPYLPGIDQTAALGRLNNNAVLFVKMLNDFSKDYLSYPTLLKKLAREGAWLDIQTMAHTVKGISGYMGAHRLFQAANDLEDRLKRGGSTNGENLIQPFADALDEVLASLAALSLKVPGSRNRQSGRSGQTQQTVPKTPVPDNFDGDDLDDLVYKLEILVDSLHRGEYASEKLFAELEQILMGHGHDDTLKSIGGLIDDIEYLDAADLVKGLKETLEGQDQG